MPLNMAVKRRGIRRCWHRWKGITRPLDSAEKEEARQDVASASSTTTRIVFNDRAAAAAAVAAAHSVERSLDLPKIRY